MTFRGYFGAHFAFLFPRIARLYEYLSGKEIPYKNNRLVFSGFYEGENHLERARFSPGLEKKVNKA